MTFIKIANFQPPAVYSQQQQQFCFCKIILNCNIYCQIHKLFSQVMWFVGMRPYLLTLFYCLSVFPALVALINFTEAWNKQKWNPVWQPQFFAVHMETATEKCKASKVCRWKQTQFQCGMEVPFCQFSLSCATLPAMSHRSTWSCTGADSLGCHKKRGQEAPPINLV